MLAGRAERPTTASQGYRRYPFQQGRNLRRPDKIGTRKVSPPRCSSGPISPSEILVNHNRPPLPGFFISVDFKGTLSCFRINTSRSVDSKGGYRRYYRTLCTSVDSKWLGAWGGGTGCGGD